MIYLRIPPKNPEELYEFFMCIARPPVKSHVAYDRNMYFFIREDWAVDAYLLAKTEQYGFWFRYKESDPPVWYKVYEKYLIKE